MPDDEIRVKIVLFGERDTGKSTLVHYFVPDAVSVDVEEDLGDGTGATHNITVGLDYGKIRIGNYSFHFFGTPGQHRFDFARKIVAKGAHFGILVLDSQVVTQRGVTSWEQGIENFLIESKLPYLICANKRDLPGVISLEKIQSSFKAPVYPIVATTGEGIGVIFNQMIETVEELIETT